MRGRTHTKNHWLGHLVVILASVLVAGCGDGAEPTGDAGAPDAAVEEPRPFVKTTDPPHGAVAVYPFELYRDDAVTLRRKIVRVTFSVPMDTSVETASITGSGGASRTVPAQWSEDARELVLAVGPPDPSDGGSLPFDYESTYAVDLGALRSASGVLLDDTHDGLDAGRLVFSTAAKDALLEHACGHTFEEPHANIVATETPASAPAVGTTHKLYVVHLPSSGMAGSYAGHASQKVPLAGNTIDAYTYTFFLSADVGLGIVDVGSAEDVPVSVREAPPVCARIRNARAAVLGEDHEYSLRFSAGGEPTFEVIFEREIVVP
ncbi:Ig-like domain-containing protein [Polyangium mundeleinium]|uniref:Ig-like domain-containing protein n=1 Tax=Polyangium mundeleinium TaxID=2995306 RepID=A0ABT5EWG6_9BACT|nr:Ig-like domain-containing protein [Polyangium mundeleinium]MDC0746158.1 Ig-like domain-containing protein [Polyangium mundeleinium]